MQNSEVIHFAVEPASRIVSCYLFRWILAENLSQSDKEVETKRARLPATGPFRFSEKALHFLRAQLRQQRNMIEKTVAGIHFVEDSPNEIGRPIAVGTGRWADGNHARPRWRSVVPLARSGMARLREPSPDHLAKTDPELRLVGNRKLARRAQPSNQLLTVSQIKDR
jgi:hypothetical protein